jgi:hypothetical protein
VFENKLRRRIFGYKGEEVKGGRGKKLHNKELQNIYFSPYIILINKSKRVR